jgi:hypothetical protein
MKSWNILKHSIKQVFGNFEGALRVSGVLYTAQFVMVKTAEGGNLPYGLELLFGLVGFLISAWIVVGWHRYVLLSEGTTLLPAFKPRRILVYLGKWIVVAILAALGWFMLGLFIYYVIAPIILLFLAGAGVPMMDPETSVNPELTMLFGLAIMALSTLPLLILFLRLSILLPAAAIGREMSVSAAWESMEGEMGMLAMLSFIVTVVAVVLGILSYFVVPMGILLFLAVQFVLGWVYLMIFASIITTLYGIYVEGRTLAYS